MAMMSILQQNLLYKTLKLIYIILQNINEYIIIMLQKKIIEHYSFSLTDKIGKGFSSVVYKGKDDLTNQVIAIKVIEMKMLQQDQIYKQLLKSQIQILKLLTNQPNVLHLFDTFSTKNNTYLMTQFCQTDLHKLIKEKKKFTLIEALTIIEQILSGYLQIHKLGFVHRDIKPANIFLKDKQYKIADFGFAVRIDDLGNHKKYNVGSPLYMSPQALKHNLYSFSSDIWAIGVILFELLKGITPWKARSQQTLYSKMINQSIQNQLFDIPQQCKQFIRRALKVDLRQRLSLQEINSWQRYFKDLLDKYQVKEQIKPAIAIRNVVKQIIPLKQINLNNITQQPVHNLDIKQDWNNKEEFLLKMPVENNGPTNEAEILIGGRQFSITESAIISYLNYCKFIYKILRLISTPLRFKFNSSKSIEMLLSINLINKIKKVWEQFQKGNNYLQIEGWYQFFGTQSFAVLKKRTQKYFKKYSILYPESLLPTVIPQDIIQRGIHELLDFLSVPSNYDEKSIIIADYLTTIYQLFDLEYRYDYNKFSTVSKIDLIVEGNPYNISLDHLNKLRNKITIIGL